jgi:succinate dehydrogenase / fumarate reductase flavoprotein subunit
MADNCGIFRDDARLHIALRDIKQLQQQFQGVQVMDQSKRFNTDVLGAIETEHLLTFSEVVVACALDRTESRGAHYRTDYPKRNDQEWLKHSMAKRGEDGTPVLSYKGVTIDWEKYPPQERKY